MTINSSRAFLVWSLMHDAVLDAVQEIVGPVRLHDWRLKMEPANVPVADLKRMEVVAVVGFELEVHGRSLVQLFCDSRKAATVGVFLVFVGDVEAIRRICADLKAAPAVPRRVRAHVLVETEAGMIDAVLVAVVLNRSLAGQPKFTLRYKSKPF